MSITKVLAQKHTLIPTEIITDPEICGEAFRLYCYLMSRREEIQKVNSKEIMSKLGIKTYKTLRKYFKQLVDSGWMEYNKEKDEYILTLKSLNTQYNE